MWTDPNGHVFTTGEVVTASTLNTYVKDNLAWLADPPRFRATNSANQSIPDSAWTSLTLDTERYDVGPMHSTVTNTSRGTVPSGGAGTYSVSGEAELQAAGSGLMIAGLWLNGTTIIADFGLDPTATTNFHAMLLCEYKLAVSDYAELRVFQGSGGALNHVKGNNYAPEFSMRWVAI